MMVGMLGLEKDGMVMGGCWSEVDRLRSGGDVDAR